MGRGMHQPDPTHDGLGVGRGYGRGVRGTGLPRPPVSRRKWERDAIQRPSGRLGSARARSVRDVRSGAARQDEAAGELHAIEPLADHTLCGLTRESLYVFPDLPFTSSRPSQMCYYCCGSARG
jgi:hypothetical protein